jgi:regulator of replication initiation timing
MEPFEQAALVGDFMLRIAPVVTRHSLQELARIHRFYSHSLEAEVTAAEHDHRSLMDRNARLTLELASHLAARLREFQDGIKEECAKEKDQAPSGKQSAKKPAA